MHVSRVENLKKSNLSGTCRIRSVDLFCSYHGLFTTPYPGQGAAIIQCHYHFSVMSLIASRVTPLMCLNDSGPPISVSPVSYSRTVLASLSYQVHKIGNRMLRLDAKYRVCEMEACTVTLRYNFDIFV